VQSTLNADFSYKSGGTADRDEVSDLPIPPPKRSKDSQESGGKSRPGRALVTRTRQGPLQAHEIYEHQLKDLLSLRRDRYSDLLAATIGAAVALLPSCIGTICNYVKIGSLANVTLEKSLEMLALTASLTAIAILRSVIKKSDKKGENIANEIRGQSAL